MTKYEIIYEALQDKVISGELTVDDIEILNDLAYEIYVDNISEYNETTSENEDITNVIDIISDGFMTVDEACKYYEIDEKLNQKVLNDVLNTLIRSLQEEKDILKLNLRNKKYEVAKKNVNTIIDILVCTKSFINNIETSCINDILNTLPTFLATSASFFTLNSLLLQNNMIKDIEKNEDKLTKKNVKHLSAIAGRFITNKELSNKISEDSDNDFKLVLNEYIISNIIECNKLKKWLTRRQKFDKTMKKFEPLMRATTISTLATAGLIKAKKNN